MDTEGQEDDLLHALSPYKPAARLAFATDVVKSIVRIPTKGPSSRIWRKIYPHSHETKTRSTGQGAKRSLDHERPQKN